MLLFSCPIMYNSLWPHGLQQARLPCPSAYPRVCPSSCPLHQWCHPGISASDALFSFCPWSFPASRTLSIRQMFAPDDQNTGASASASVLPMSIQGWFPLRLTGLISLQSRGLLGVFSSNPVQRHQFFNSLAFCLLYHPVLITVHDHWEDYSLDYMELCRQSNVSCVLQFMGHKESDTT